MHLIGVIFFFQTPCISHESLSPSKGTMIVPQHVFTESAFVFLIGLDLMT